MTKVLRYSAALLFVTALSLLVGGSAAAQSTNNPRYRQFRDTAAASITTPAAGNVRLFFDSTGFYWKNSAGVSTAIGGSGITGLTAAVIPAVATGGSSLEDSKMTTSGTNKGTWTLYDDTASAVTGVTSLTIQEGAAQAVSASYAPPLRVLNNAGTQVFAVTPQGNLNIVAVASLGWISNTDQRFLLNSTEGLKFRDTDSAPNQGVHWNGSTYSALDIGIIRSALGILKVTDGSTGQGGIGLSDAATNTVSDALILRHATSGTAAASFGTGLLFQGEDAAGNMQDMASIDAVYTDATDGSEDVAIPFQVVVSGTMTTVATLSNSLLSFPNHVRVESAVGALYLSSSQNMRFAPNLIPEFTNSYDIGSPSNLVRNGYVSTSIQGTRTQAISDNAAAATFVTIAVPTSDTTVGGRIFYTITAIDAGTAIQTKTGTYSFGLNNIGGTVTGNGTDVLEHSQLSTGTLAPTFSVNISGTNAQFQLVLDTSLDAAAETLKIEYRVQIDSGTATVTPAT